jgi:LPXTG-motif cell wall-anchored protein
MNGLARKGAVFAVSAMAAGGVLMSAGYATADSSAGGDAEGSPGVLSGNSVQAPVHVPVNVCGNTVDAAGLLDPAFGNSCSNTPTPAPPEHTPQPAPPADSAPPAPKLAHTGAAGVGAAAAGGLALLLGGAALYRRAAGSAAHR